MGKVDLTSISGLLVVIALILGAMVWHVADAVGSNLAIQALSWLGQFLPGGNPATATNENSGPAFGGE
jgi:hypothetical protein